MKKTKYAISGLSVRGLYHFVMPILGIQPWENVSSNDFSDFAELVGIHDIDLNRITAFNEKTGHNIPGFSTLEALLEKTIPDVLIVVGPDYTHCQQIIQGLEAGCDVIVEKPMVISSEESLRVIAAEKRTGKKVKVAFNYRYTPTHQKLRRVIMEGRLGKITNIEFIYNLDTFHGASYFFRWNRERSKSGGLNIHKCCHHFDLISWLIGDLPEKVFAFGALNYFGPHGAHRPKGSNGEPLDPSETKRQCPYFQKNFSKSTSADSNAISTGWDAYDLPYDVQYPPDQPRYIYDDAIDIEDTYSAVVRYRGGASMTYSCNFSAPWEGYTLAINGTEGRLEISNRVDPNPTGNSAPAGNTGLITFLPLFGGCERIEIPAVAGGHGGADIVIQRDLFEGISDNSRDLQLLAGSEAGAYAVATGEAVMRSIRDESAISIESLLPMPTP